MSQREHMTVAEKRAAKKLAHADKVAQRRTPKAPPGSALAKLPFMGAAKPEPAKPTVTVEPLTKPGPSYSAYVPNGGSPGARVEPPPVGYDNFGKKPIEKDATFTWTFGWWEDVGTTPKMIWHPARWVQVDDFKLRPPGPDWTWYPTSWSGSTKTPGAWKKRDTWSPTQSAYPTSHTTRTPRPRPRPTVESVVMKQISGATGFPRIAQEDLTKDASITQLCTILTYRRPHESVTEEAFIAKFISVLPGVTKDKYGNRWVRIPKVDGTEADILFSCHTDTVHRDPGMQKVMIGDGRIFTEDSNCLGADDGAGVWLMLQMIEAKVPGLYIFHRNEEHGGHGSRHIAEKHAPKIKHCKAAIAFDRKDFGDVITYQSGGVCASQTFAKSLAKMLGGKFSPCASGVFTDTANYTHIIGECTNISVGYFNAHGPTEWVDAGFLSNLRDRLITAEWDSLEFERKPAPKTVYGAHGGRYGGGAAYGGAYPGTGGMWDWDEDDWSNWDKTGKPAEQPAANGHKAQKPAKGGRQGAERYTGVGALPADGEKFLSPDQKRQMNNYAEEIKRRAVAEVQNLQDLMIMAHLYPETLAHFLAEKGIRASEVQSWFKRTSIPGWATWDRDDVQ